MKTTGAFLPHLPLFQRATHAKLLLDGLGKWFNIALCDCSDVAC
jgi:hypothetical protein